MKNKRYRNFNSIVKGTCLLILSAESFAYVAAAERSLILNNCHCATYMTVVEEGRYDQHNMRLELWIPQNGLHIREVYTQEYNLNGNPSSYATNLIVQNHTGNDHDRFEKKLDATHWPQCQMSHNIDGSFQEVNCNLTEE